MDSKFRFVYNPEDTFRVEFSTVVGFGGRVDIFDKGHKSRNAELFWAEFYWPSYDQYLVWRAACQYYDKVTRLMLIDDQRFEKLKTLHLLKQWSFSEVDVSYKLLRTECGCELCRALKERRMLGITSALSEDSMKVVYGAKLPVVHAMISGMNEVIGL